jgi:iron complex outermembrane receptor protein
VHFIDQFFPLGEAMNQAQNQIRTPRLAPMALAVAAGIAAITALPAYAQSEDETELERIEVTGSRIRRVDVETSQPILTITREEIEQQGFQSVTDILQNLAAMGNPPLSRASPLSAGEAAGGQFISLRDLGANRTLVLLDGKRVGITTGGIQDISLIPVSMIERVEILKDGASSIYGSDAIAGVVNLITRQGFNGLQANVYYGEQSEGDGEIEKYDFVMGATGERGAITTTVEYGTEGGVAASDRPFSAFPRSSRYPNLGWTTVSQWGAIAGFRGPGCAPAPAPACQYSLDRGEDWRDFLNNFHLQNGAAPDGDVSNTNLQTDLRTPVERRSFFTSGYFDLSDTLRFRADALYGERVSDRQVAGYPYQSAAFGTPMSINSYYNPLGNAHGFATPQATQFWRRTWEVPRIETATTHTWRFTAGLEGSFTFADRYFDWDVSWLYNNNQVVQENYGNLNVSRVALAVGPSFVNAQGIVQCGTPAAPIALTACVPWNPFIPFGRVGDGGLTDNAALQNFLFQTLNSTGDTESMIASANITGEIISLPAGAMSFAFGLEHRSEDGKFTPDAMAVTGNSTTLSAGPTEGGYSLDEAYLELLIPVLADMSFAKELSFNLATRYSDYDTFGSTNNSKAGFKWAPTDTLLFRGTWAQGFRAPTIAQLYGGGSQTFSFFTDPCDTLYGASASNAAVRAACAEDIANAATFRQLQQGFVPSTQANAQTPIAFFSGSNPFLLPEESIGKNLGFVWSPGDFLEGFNLGIDWWKIRVEDTMVTDTPTQILNDCYIEGIASRCALFTRDPVSGIVNQMSFGQRNAGYIEVEGYDIDLSYRWETDFGSFNASLLSTYVAQNNFKTTNDAGVRETQQNSFGSNYRLRSNGNLSWNYGDFGVSYGFRYYSKMKEACLSIVVAPDECSEPTYIDNRGVATAINVLGSNTVHDVQFRWAAPWDATISVGANNVTDHYGPPMYTQIDSNVSYNGGFDIGRFWYVKYQQNF